MSPLTHYRGLGLAFCKNGSTRHFWIAPFLRGVLQVSSGLTAHTFS
jgi:hypothetical protein